MAQISNEKISKDRIARAIERHLGNVGYEQVEQINDRIVAHDVERGEVAVIELAIVEEFGEREPEFDRGAFESAALAYIVTHDITDVRLRRDIVEVVVAAGDRAMVKHKINASTD